MSKSLLVAFHLPQFHAIPENDAWWGKGFTEWTNVRKSVPQYSWHEQPHRPWNDDYYDLSVPGSLGKQARLAKEYGIGAFCFYHYWFSGRRLLEKPVERILSGEEDFDLPFCLCWANEAWTRRWDGGSRKVLMEQHYEMNDHQVHILHLIEAFRDPRYLRMDGKPVLLIYRASLIPDMKAMLDCWRQECLLAGIEEPYLLRVESLPGESGDPRRLGFDGAIEFQPAWERIGLRWPENWITRRLWRLVGRWVPAIFSYDKVIRLESKRSEPDWISHPCVMPGWDNTPRRGEQGIIFQGATPEKFRLWLSQAKVRAEAQPVPQPLVFVNAWNEWAEGAHLEPDIRNGFAYLNAVKSVYGTSR